MSASTPLSESDARLLEFAEKAPRSPAARDEAVTRALGISAVRYHQRLNRLLDDPAAAAAHPTLVSRLRRIRDQRAESRERAKSG
ncbi:DUF3263 domain-containing protein [Corynebacterium sp. CCM 9185]|uniref:DUF3263 domain-containing protein n=1 Tax=Corynebacterium marambiense TaxID=2765364 RepID=A0ABS0VW58_9CORY|nr:DUF3263 domain-containing protein [Corynebacterium marambiense]MBI9001013.1 DUF3263 domain-containing protein [Corynebacterium marambiense]MCK7664256.1 DUF3263 domain-containing protein [Corynebacterium marambiense]MCX7543068.1 DUF3263 domain-containing protein [Corynebacterium marambiense]